MNYTLEAWTNIAKFHACYIGILEIYLGLFLKLHVFSVGLSLLWFLCYNKCKPQISMGPTSNKKGLNKPPCKNVGLLV